MWPFLRTLKQNPIYLREQGRWGEPNSFFANINRFSPFIVLGALVLGICGGNNALSLAGLDSGTEWLILFVCLPNIAMQMLTWGALFMTPALTAPAISEEIQRGTWDILRLTPQPVHHILFAKLLGSLSRLKIWWILLIVSVIQALATIVGVIAAASTYELVSVVVALATGATLLLRPWLEIGYAALLGITISTWARSSRAALTASYSLIFATKLLVGFLSLVFAAILDSFWSSGGELVLVGITLAPLLIYGTLDLILAAVLYRRAKSVERWSVQS